MSFYFVQVRDVQRMTGAMIKLPEDQATQGEETFVEIFASFMAAMVSVFLYIKLIRTVAIQSYCDKNSPLYCKFCPKQILYVRCKEQLGLTHNKGEYTWFDILSNET